MLERQVFPVQVTEDVISKLTVVEPPPAVRLIGAVEIGISIVVVVVGREFGAVISK